jgi:hypothetical protein
VVSCRITGLYRLFRPLKEFAMNSTRDKSIADAHESGEFDATLRLIACLAPPDGLEERVQAGLKDAQASGRARVLPWPTALRLDSAWMRSAAAAAIVAAVVGGSWGVYSRVQSIQPVRAITVPLHLSAPGGFSSAGAMRTPQTLNGPLVARPAIVVQQPPTATPQPENPAAKPAIKALPHAGKTALAKKAIASPAPQKEK